jgi:oxalate decarboxylase/phosphoglucose isomerase-like protein (cupin superfamily)
MSQRLDFRPSQMKPTKTTAGGEVKIIDSRNFPVTPIAAAIVRLKPGGLRELHWHPNADEWQYYVSGEGRMIVFAAGRVREQWILKRGMWDMFDSRIRTMSKTPGIQIWYFLRCSRVITTKTYHWPNGWRTRHISW